MSSFAASLSGEIFAGGYGPLPDRGSWNHDAGTEPFARPVLEASRCRGATQLVSIRKATPPARAVCSFGLAARRFEFTVVFGEPAQTRFWRVPGRGKGGLKRNSKKRAWLVSVGFSYMPSYQSLVHVVFPKWVRLCSDHGLMAFAST